VLVMPYDGSNCINLAAFKKGHGHKYFNNSCFSGLSEWAFPSGCGDLTCSNHSRHKPDMNNIGHVSSCDPDFTYLAANHYYSPDANASLSCGGELLPIDKVQKEFKNEIGSTYAALPKAGDVLQMVNSWFLM
jgi:hypothetical protein